MNNVILIYPGPDSVKPYRFGYSLLLLYVASTMRQHGYSVEFLDFSVIPYCKETLYNHLDENTISILEIDAFPLKRSVNIKNAELIAADIRSFSPKTKIIAIGKQCTLFHKQLVFSDITVSGDCEIDIWKIVDNMRDGNCKKVFYDMGTLSSLCELPMPAYDLLSTEQICGKTAEGNMHLAPSALLETSRGCPGTCSFCQRKGWGGRIQLVPDAKVYSIFSHLLDSGIKNIWITDENFTGNLPRAKRLLGEFANIRANRAVRLCLSSWVKVDNEFLDLAKAAGVSIISFGIETIEKTNQDFYKKNIDIPVMVEMLRHADEIGIYTVGNFIIGSPFDTEEIIKQEINFAIDSPLDVINVKTLDYMMGSELFESLPNNQKKDIHFFACKEMGVSIFTRNELKQIAQSFAKQFRASRVEKMRKKILSFGEPYIGK